LHHSTSSSAPSPPRTQTTSPNWSASIEESAKEDFTGELVQQRQAHVVAVFVPEEQRGDTAASALLRTAVSWAPTHEA
ncbi:hypothetical protein ACWHA1_29120, partial [Streptomyces decoyicus]